EALQEERRAIEPALRHVDDVARLERDLERFCGIEKILECDAARGPRLGIDHLNMRPSSGLFGDAAGIGEYAHEGRIAIELDRAGMVDLAENGDKALGWIGNVHHVLAAESDVGEGISRFHKL